MEPSYGYSHFLNHENTRPANVHGKEHHSSESFSTAGIDFQTLPSSYNEDTKHLHTNADDSIQSWEQLVGETSQSDQIGLDVSQSDFLTHETASFEFHQNQDDTYPFTQDSSSEEVNADMDYETLIRSRHLYYDPDPQIIRKPSNITQPIVYNQNISVRFLKPPPIEPGPLIIREVRPPQPPPLPPLVIRQRAAPPRSPSPIILREKPPPIPESLTTKVVTKTLPPLPLPPRSVVIERLPPLPAKPRDIIIERWVPYEATQKRKTIVQRAEPPKSYPKPRNVIITYEPVQARVVRRVERLGIKPEDPRAYAAQYGHSLLDTNQLLSQIRQLGITEDITPPHVFNQQSSFQVNGSTGNYDALLKQQNTSYGTSNYSYGPTNQNFSTGAFRKTNRVESKPQPIRHDYQFYSTNGVQSTPFTQYDMSI